MIVYSQDTWHSVLLILTGWRGSVYRSIWLTVLVYSTWGLVVATLSTTVKNNSIDDGWGLDDTMHAMAATALGFLLVFRAQIAYNRFWDAQTVFTLLCADARELGCMVTTFVDSSLPDAQSRRINVLRIIGGLMAMVTNILTSKSNQVAEIRDYNYLYTFFTADEVALVRSCAGNKPVLLCTWLRQEICTLNRQGYISRLDLRLVDPRVTALTNSWHILSRILSTPIPFPYVQMLQVSLAMYFIMLPFVFLPKLGANNKIRMQMPFIMAIFTFVFYGLKNLSWELESPFGVGDNKLPLQTLAETVQHDLKLFLWDDKCQCNDAATQRPARTLSKAPSIRSRNSSRSSGSSSSQSLSDFSDDENVSPDKKSPPDPDRKLRRSISANISPRLRTSPSPHPDKSRVHSAPSSPRSPRSPIPTLTNATTSAKHIQDMHSPDNALLNTNTNTSATKRKATRRLVHPDLAQLPGSFRNGDDEGNHKLENNNVVSIAAGSPPYNVQPQLSAGATTTSSPQIPGAGVSAGVGVGGAGGPTGPAGSARQSWKVAPEGFDPLEGGLPPSVDRFAISASGSSAAPRISSPGSNSKAKDNGRDRNIKGRASLYHVVEV